MKGFLPPLPDGPRLFLPNRRYRSGRDRSLPPGPAVQSCNRGIRTGFLNHLFLAKISRSGPAPVPADWSGALQYPWFFVICLLKSYIFLNHRQFPVKTVKRSLTACRIRCHSRHPAQKGVTTSAGACPFVPSSPRTKTDFPSTGATSRIHRARPKPLPNCRVPPFPSPP